MFVNAVNATTAIFVIAVVCNTDYYKEKSGKLGPDPLRQDADGERLWEKMRKSKKPIGGILMDQTCVAGIGNIYRAEILFKVTGLQ